MKHSQNLFSSLCELGPVLDIEVMKLTWFEGTGECYTDERNSGREHKHNWKSVPGPSISGFNFNSNWSVFIQIQMETP